jgi:hypothetical protein
MLASISCIKVIFNFTSACIPDISAYLSVSLLFTPTGAELHEEGPSGIHGRDGEQHSLQKRISQQANQQLPATPAAHAMFAEQAAGSLAKPSI